MKCVQINTKNINRSNGNFSSVILEGIDTVKEANENGKRYMYNIGVGNENSI